MARAKKDRVFDLFKTKFKITFFYKPSMDYGDQYYYIVLEDAVRLRLMVISDAIIIDGIIPLTKSYMKPIYESIVSCIMEQEDVTVLVSILGDTFEIQQICMLHGAPVIEDSKYITVSKKMYEKWVSQNKDINKYGFYLLSVSDMELGEPKEEPVNEVKPNVVEESFIASDTPFEQIKITVLSWIPNLTIVDLTANSFRGFISPEDSFVIEFIDNTVYIKDVLSSPESTLNLVQIMDMMNAFHKITEIVPNVLIVNIVHREVYRICMVKQYRMIEEEQKLPLNHLFKQAFHGYGTFRII